MISVNILGRLNKSQQHKYRIVELVSVLNEEAVPDLSSGKVVENEGDNNNNNNSNNYNNRISIAPYGRNFGGDWW